MPTTVAEVLTGTPIAPSRACVLPPPLSLFLLFALLFSLFLLVLPTNPSEPAQFVCFESAGPEVPRVFLPFDRGNLYLGTSRGLHSVLPQQNPEVHLLALGFSPLFLVLG